MPKIFYIDLFSGAGGTTTGIHLAGAEVVACVNHDAKAIESHKENHPDCLHFIEDIRDYKVIMALKQIVLKLRKENPGCIIIIWASLECTHFSRAKGGGSRKQDSRTLAYTLNNYIDELDPDYIQLENVREFLNWGPIRIKEVKSKSTKTYTALKINKKGEYVYEEWKERRREYYTPWIDSIKAMNYKYDYRLLNAADFDAVQSRLRYFGVFARPELPIKWPEPTRAKNPENTGNLFHMPLKKWRAVREVLDLQDEGRSIFDRVKPLVDPTLSRVYAGLEKFVANGEEAFSKVYNSGNDASRVKSLNEPIGSLTTQNSHAVVKCKFMMKNFSGHPQSKVHDLNRPAGAITTIDHNSIVSVDKEFLTSYYGNGGAHDIKAPCPTVTCKDRFAVIKPQFMDNQYGNGYASSIENPNGTITTSPKQQLVTINQFLFNPQFNDKGRSIERPCFTLIAKMDKRPPYLISVQKGMEKAIIKEGDSDMMIKIKRFMQKYGISDIKMRMLKIPELLQIQGFPKDYVLKGTQADQKKFIGNAVEVNMAKAIAKATQEAIYQYQQEVAA